MIKKRIDVEGAPIGVEFSAVNGAGEDVDASVLESAGVAFDPSNAPLDLTKDEKRRTTALMMAIQAYNNIIIKDADYLREAHEQARRNDGPVIRPATMDAMVVAAIQFDAFIAGRLVVQSGISAPRLEEPKAVDAVDPHAGGTTD